jgi:hypothetical protein
MFKNIQESGHVAVIVTGRSKVGIWEQEVYQTLEYFYKKYNIEKIPVVFAGSQWKREAAKNAGYNINIWIDNSPEYIDKQYILPDMNIGEKDNYLSPETSGKIKQEMVKTFEEAWSKVSEDLKIYPKRLPQGEVKDKLWNKIDQQAKNLLNKYLS